jgi:hypothetical protein
MTFYFQYEFEDMTLEKHPLPPMLLPMDEFPLPSIPLCPIHDSVDEKENDPYRSLNFTLIAKKAKRRKGKRLSRDKKAEGNKRRDALARRQLQELGLCTVRDGETQDASAAAVSYECDDLGSGTVEDRLTLWYGMIAPVIDCD